MPLPFLLLLDEAVDTDLFPAPIVLELQVPGSQLDVALHPAALELELQVPASQLDVVLHPEPVLLALTIPAPQLDVALHPAPIALGLLIPPSSFLSPPRLIHMTGVSLQHGTLDRVRFRH